jgi:Ankyrin repeats (3 copies)
VKRFAIILLSLGGLVVAQAASAQEAGPSRVRAAAARALVAIQKAQESWYTTNKQVCASCHHQYQPALAYRVARDHGVPFNESITRADAAKAFNFSDIDRAVQYSYVIEPSVDDARAVLNNDIEMARILIEGGATVNVVDKMGMTPLLWAANIDFGDTQMIELLLQSGAKADVRNKDGLTPLELARKWGHANLVPALSATKATN